MLDHLAVRLVAGRARADAVLMRARLQREGDTIVAIGKDAEQAGSAAEAVRHDVEFHPFIYDMAGSPLIRPTAEAHWLFLRRVMIGMLPQAGRGPLVWAQHAHIRDLPVAGEAERVVALATDHVLGARQALIAAMETGRADHLSGAAQGF